MAFLSFRLSVLPKTGFHCTAPVLASLLILVSSPLSVHAQATQTTNSGSSSKRFSYVIQSTYGVSVSSTATPGFQVEGEASMGILPGSYVRNQAGTGGVTMSPTGITVTGIDAGLNLNLDPDKTSFKAKVSRSSDVTETTSTAGAEVVSGTASVSATGSATTTFTAESTESFQDSIFTKNF